jgi:hypothetical protein
MKEIERLRKENEQLRALVQTNPGWSCPYGTNPHNTLARCPAGFPGCACADDRLAILCESPDESDRRFQRLSEALEQLKRLMRANRCICCSSMDTQEIDIVFDGEPGHISPRFVECEDMSGAGISVGKWIKREHDNVWVLRLKVEI